MVVDLASAIMENSSTDWPTDWHWISQTSKQANHKKKLVLVSEAAKLHLPSANVFPTRNDARRGSQVALGIGLPPKVLILGSECCSERYPRGECQAT